MEVLQFIQDHYGATISTILAGASAWFFARKKNNSSLQGDELSQVKEALSIYKEMVKDLGDQINKLQAKYELLEQEFITYKQTH